jgi:RecA-family ATPase
MENNTTPLEKTQYQISRDALAPLKNPEVSSHFLTADEILTTKWPEPIWAIPGILPVGLSILAGVPKVGKSWLALQIAQAVAAGGVVLGKKVDKGSVLYLALEDSPRMLQNRMQKQSWPVGLDVDFITNGEFDRFIGDLRGIGMRRLTNLIEQRGYRLVVVDTLSRVLKGDQNEVAVMTAELAPVQEMAHKYNCAMLFNDHHKKAKGEAQDAIADILGSTAKGAIADTVLGLYRERGKSGAKLSITGREVEETCLDIYMDWVTGCWQLNTANDNNLEQRSELLEALKKNKGRASTSELAKAVDRNRGTVYKQMSQFEGLGKVKKDGKIWVFPDI